jgi:hypothetical protein
MAGTGEVTLGASRHLPAHGIARRARSREHGASQAEEERPNRSFFRSQAEVRLLHARSLAGGRGTGYQTRVACIPLARFALMRATKQPRDDHRHPMLPWRGGVRGAEPPWLVMKTDRNGRKNPICTFVSIFFCGNGSGFGKCRFENGIEICGHTETDKYKRRARKLN